MRSEAPCRLDDTDVNNNNDHGDHDHDQHGDRDAQCPGLPSDVRGRDRLLLEVRDV